MAGSCHLIWSVVLKHGLVHSEFLCALKATIVICMYYPWFTVSTVALVYGYGIKSQPKVWGYRENIGVAISIR